MGNSAIFDAYNQKTICAMRETFCESTRFIRETLRHAKRTGASYMSVTFDSTSRRLMFEYDGDGFKDLSCILNFDENKWQSFSQAEDSYPEAMICVSALFACASIKVSSNGHLVNVETASALKNKSFNVEEAKEVQGVCLSFLLTSEMTRTLSSSNNDRPVFLQETVAPTNIETILKNSILGYPLPTTFNGKQIPRPYALNGSSEFETISIGKITTTETDDQNRFDQVYCMIDGVLSEIYDVPRRILKIGAPRRRGERRGLRKKPMNTQLDELSREADLCGNMHNFVHLDNQKFCIDVYTELTFDFRGVAAPHVNKAINQHLADNLRKIEKEVSAHEFVEKYRESAGYLAPEILDDKPLLPDDLATLSILPNDYTDYPFRPFAERNFRDSIVPENAVVISLSERDDVGMDADWRLNLKGKPPFGPKSSVTSVYLVKSKLPVICSDIPLTRNHWSRRSSIDLKSLEGLGSLYVESIQNPSELIEFDGNWPSLSFRVCDAYTIRADHPDLDDLLIDDIPIIETPGELLVPKKTCSDRLEEALCQFHPYFSRSERQLGNDFFSARLLPHNSDLFQDASNMTDMVRFNRSGDGGKLLKSTISRDIDTILNQLSGRSFSIEISDDGKSFGVYENKKMQD